MRKHYAQDVSLCIHTLYTDNSLVLNLTVDDHTRRLEKLEGVLARMEMLGKFLRVNVHACMYLYQ